MLNSSGLFELLAPPELAAALDPGPSQEASSSMITDTATNPCQRPMPTFMAGASFLLLPSVVPTRSYKRPAPADKPIEPTGNCARRRENPASWRPRAYTHTR